MSRPRARGEDDRYTYPGSGGVLVNAFDIRDRGRLDEAMNDYASVALAQLSLEPVPDRLSVRYLFGVHERMFEPVVPAIAGRVRDVDVQATGTGIVYCRPGFIRQNLVELFGQLDQENYLAGLDAATFAARLAERLGTLSVIHPFRDGNTRAQSFYVTALAARAGHRIDWARVDADELRAYRLLAIAGAERDLARYLHERLITPKEPGLCEPRPGLEVPTLTTDHQRCPTPTARRAPTPSVSTRHADTPRRT